MKDPEYEVLDAIRSIFGLHGFRIFRDYLARVEAEETHRAIHDPGDASVFRGRAQMIRELRGIIENSPERANQTEIRRDKEASRRRTGC